MHDKKNMPASGTPPLDPTEVAMSLRAQLHETSLDEIMGRLRGVVGELHPVAQISSGREVPGDPGEALSLPVLMDRVREEVERRRLADIEDTQPEATSLSREHEPFPRWQPRASSLPIKRAYELSELLQFSDAEFIDTAYRILLRRPVETMSREQYLAVIRNGYMSKVEVLGRIRFSREGKQCGVHVEGLLRPYLIHRWRRIPFLGAMLATAAALIRLPRLSNRLQAIEQAAARDTQALGDFLNQCIGVMEQRFKAETDDIRAVQGELRKMSMARQQELQSAVARIETLKDRLEAERRVLRSIDEGHQQLEDEARTRFAQLEAMASKLNKDVNAVFERGEEAKRNVLERISSLDQSNESLSVEFDKFRDARNKAAQDVSRHLESVDKAMSSLLEDIRENRKARENAVEDVMERLAAVDAIAAELNQTMQSRSAEFEHRHQEVMDQLAAHDSNLGAIKLDGEKTAEFIRSMEAYRAELEKRHHEIVNHLSAHDSMIEAVKKGDAQTRRSGLEVQRQLMKLLDSSAPTVKRVQGGDVIDTGGKGDQVLAPAYVDFEDTFRGTHDDIKARVGEYLKTFAGRDIQASSGLVLDLGCGRGEWLEVLDENGFDCRGVDLNPVMLDDLRGRNFDVVEADALEYLRGLKANSVAAITSMHLVEHVPHNILIRMLDECFRVLKPKGLLILETPNPENLTVGACWFYLDPTHRNPIPPGLLQWTVSARGFEQTDIERLSEHRMQPDIPPVADDVPASAQINKIISWFTAPPDYAVIATKPAAQGKEGNGTKTVSAEKSNVPSQPGKRAKKKKPVKKGKPAKDA